MLRSLKRLLLIWIRGPKKTKMSALEVSVVSERLEKLRSCLPNLFARKPRSLQFIARWKETELRQFLLYTGKIVLKGLLRKELFNYFLTLNIALSIFVCPRLAQQHHAQQCITTQYTMHNNTQQRTFKSAKILEIDTAVGNALKYALKFKVGLFKNY